MRVVIIEDEDLTAEDLAQTLMRLDPSIEICGRLASVKEALAFLSSAVHIDLIFSDIQLGDGDSFDVFMKVPPRVPIVFCTAYDQYMLDAFKNFGIDYILKPFSDQHIKNALQKYDLMKRSFNMGVMDLLGEMEKKTAPVRQEPKSLIVSSGDRIIPLKIKDIALCYIEFDNVFVKTFSGKDYLINKSLEEMEIALHHDFFRVNRQHIINRSVVDFASTSFTRKLILKLHVEYSKKITVSREKQPVFMEWLQN